MCDKNKCPFMEKRADNAANPNVEKYYEEGDRWRPYCISQQTWCTFKFDFHECLIFNKAGE